MGILTKVKNKAIEEYNKFEKENEELELKEENELNETLSNARNYIMQITKQVVDYESGVSKEKPLGIILPYTRPITYVDKKGREFEADLPEMLDDCFLVGLNTVHDREGKKENVHEVVALVDISGKIISADAVADSGISCHRGMTKTSYGEELESYDTFHDLLSASSKEEIAYHGENENGELDTITYKEAVDTITHTTMLAAHLNLCLKDAIKTNNANIFMDEYEKAMAINPDIDSFIDWVGAESLDNLKLGMSVAKEELDELETSDDIEKDL